MLLCSNADAAIQASRTFDGTNDEIDWGNVQDTGTGNRSVALWVKRTDTATTHALAGKLNTLGSGAGYMMYSTDDAVNWFITDGTDDHTIGFNVDINAVWTMTGATWHGTDQNSYVFINGVQQASGNYAGAMDTLTNSVEFATGENGAESDDATMTAGWVSAGGNFWDDYMFNQLYWYPHVITAMNGLGSTNMTVPAWDGASPEIDITNAFNGTVTGSGGTSTDGPPIMVGGMGMSY
jgi:hypothetical protein